MLIVTRTAHAPPLKIFSQEFKARVIKVLEENSLDQARTSKLGQDDFLRLLAVFNKAGVHFS